MAVAARRVPERPDGLAGFGSAGWRGAGAGGAAALRAARDPDGHPDREHNDCNEKCAHIGSFAVIQNSKFSMQTDRGLEYKGESAALGTPMFRIRTCLHFSF
jgi:hypothetical protein